MESVYISFLTSYKLYLERKFLEDKQDMKHGSTRLEMVMPKKPVSESLRGDLW